MYRLETEQERFLYGILMNSNQNLAKNYIFLKSKLMKKRYCVGFSSKIFPMCVCLCIDHRYPNVHFHLMEILSSQLVLMANFIVGIVQRCQNDWLLHQKIWLTKKIGIFFCFHFSHIIQCSS